MKKTAHIIYPFNLKKDINPWSIGNNIFHALKYKYKVKTYVWTSIDKISPQNGDVLIGHAHPNPLTIFRRSVKSRNWFKKILIQPYNEDPLLISHLYNLLPLCDYFIGICGSYWMKRLSKSYFKTWKKKFIQIDLGLNKKNYPFIKKKFNNKNKRKFIYIGNDYAYNNYAKNTQYLKKISQKIGLKKFGTAGNKKIGQINHHGWLNFQNKKSLSILRKYDFMIQTSKNDANPSTVLESISWGLIPIITKECGYENLNKKTYIPLNSINKATDKLNALQKLGNKELEKIQIQNYKILEKKYNWKKFQDKIRYILLKKKIKSEIKYKVNEIIFFKKNLKNSPNYYLRINMIFYIIKSNIKLVMKKIFN